MDASEAEGWKGVNNRPSEIDFMRPGPLVTNRGFLCLFVVSLRRVVIIFVFNSELESHGNSRPGLRMHSLRHAKELIRRCEGVQAFACNHSSSVWTQFNRLNRPVSVENRTKFVSDLLDPLTSFVGDVCNCLGKGHTIN